MATPANAKVLRVNLENRLKEMEDYSSFDCSLNYEERDSQNSKIGVISSGVAYQYSKSAEIGRASCRERV